MGEDDPNLHLLKATLGEVEGCDVPRMQDREVPVCTTEGPHIPNNVLKKLKWLLLDR